MKKSEIIDKFWRDGFFKNYRTSKEISEKIWNEFEIDAGNIIMGLKRKDYLRKYPQGWRHIRPTNKVKDKEERHETSKNPFNELLIHEKIKEVSERWFNQEDYDVAIERAFKRVIKLVQEKSGERGNGVPLMQKVFSEKKPILAFNEGKTKTDSDEQVGMMYLYMGAVFSIRNVRFHKELENDEKTNALHQIIFASFLVKRLDDTKKI